MKKLFYLFILISLSAAVHAQSGRSVLDFDQNWTFNLGDVPNGQNVDFNDASWRKLNLPHDWGIEGEFKKENPGAVSKLIDDGKNFKAIINIGIYGEN